MFSQFWPPWRAVSSRRGVSAQMGRKGNNAGGASDPAMERLNFLHQLALQCGGRLGDVPAGGTLARHYAFVMRGVANRTVTRVGAAVKRCYCRHCFRRLMVGRGATVSVRWAHGPSVATRCDGCGLVRRVPFATTAKRHSKRRRRRANQQAAE